jgi:hypothetical protein
MRASKSIYHPNGDADDHRTVEAALDVLKPFSGILTYFAALTDPGADRIMFWDGSETSGGWLSLSGLSISSTTLSVDAATTSAAGKIEHATDAEIRAATSGNLAVTAASIETASASVALTDAATIAFDWDAGINFTVTLGGNRTLGNPTNGQPGTWRTILFTQDGTGSRTLSFDTQYVFPNGDPPVLSTAAGSNDRLMFFCRSSTVFECYGAGIGLAA